MRNWIFKFYLLFIISFIIKAGNNKLYAQNLVKNPSFENYLHCPIGNHFDTSLVDWGFSSQNAGVSYYNSCAPSSLYGVVGVPQNMCGYQLAHTGNGYAEVLVYYYNYNNPSQRSYLTGSFLSILKKDSLYCVSYYVSNCDSCSNGAIKNVDAHISDTLLNWSNGWGYNLKDINPQIKSKQLLTDRIGWTMVSGIYKAHGGEQYITIGNFYPIMKLPLFLMFRQIQVHK